MQLKVRVQGCPNATSCFTWKDDASIDEIKLAFCRANAVSAHTCSLSGDGPLLKHLTKTSKSRSTSGDQPTAELMASFPPSLGFYIGHSLNPAALDEYMVLPGVWAQAAADFGRHPYVASVVSDEAICSQIIDLPATGFLDLDTHEMIHLNLRPEVLTTTTESAAVLMLCLRYIRTAAIKEGLQFGLTPDHALATTLDEMHRSRAQTLRKKGLSGLSNVGTSPLSPHVALLRGTMLIIKAASLSPEVHGNPPKPYSAKRSLWNTAQIMCAQAHTSAMQASSQLTSLPEPGPLWADLHQARQMSSLTVQLVISVLRHHLKEANHTEHQPKEYMLVNCCIIINAFLTATNSPVLRRLSQTVAEAIVSSGGLALLMATLDQLKVSAKYAFPVLHHLVDTGTLPAKEVCANEAMVARMQGVRRLSTLLCPLYSEGQADQLGRAKYAFEARSLTDVTHAVGHISFLSEVARVMVQLLKCHPISRPAKGAPSCKWEDNGWDLFPSGVLDAAKPWPTPSDAQWAEIKTISCRSMVLLEWLIDELSSKGPSHEEYGCLLQLRGSLVLLLHRLLLPHMLDRALDIGDIARFGVVPILHGWTLHPPNDEIMNQLGFALLRRISMIPPPLTEPSKARPSRGPCRPDATLGLWILMDPQYAASGSSSFNQLRTAAALEALHMPPFMTFDPLLLASTPSLTQALPAAMRSLPKLGQRLTACAVWAKACLADLDPGIREAAATVPAVSRFLLKSTPPAHCNILAEEGVFQAVCELQKSPHPLCSKSAEQGVFQVVYELLLLGLQEESPSRTDEDLLGLARALTSVGKLLKVLPSTLPQLPVSVAQAVIDFLTTIPTATKSFGLQGFLLQTCLLFIQALPKSMQPGIKGLHKSMMQTLHTCNRLTWCGLNAPLNSDLGLPAYTPPTLQPAVLEYILLHCPDHRSMWAEEPLARVSCVLWMVDMMHFCLRHALQDVDGVDDSLKTHFYLEPCCLKFASFVPHLAVIRHWTRHFEVLIPKSDPRSLSALAVHNFEGLPYQGGLSKQVACAALQLLFLLLLKLKHRGADLTKLCLEKDKLSLIPQQDRPLFSSKLNKAIAEFHDGVQELLSFLEVHLLPFIEKMRDSPLWEKKVCQVILDKCWCGQAEWVYKECVQQLGGKVSDALILRITAAFRHPDDKTPVQLASLDRLQKEGACKTEMQLARVLAAHKAAMAYAQASEGEHPEGPKSKLGQEMVFGRLEDTAQKFAAARASSKAKPGQSASTDGSTEGSTEGPTSKHQAGSKAQLGGSTATSGGPAGGSTSGTRASSPPSLDHVLGRLPTSQPQTSSQTQPGQSTSGGPAGGSTSGPSRLRSTFRQKTKILRPHASSRAQPGQSASAAVAYAQASEGEHPEGPKPKLPELAFTELEEGSPLQLFAAAHACSMAQSGRSPSAGGGSAGESLLGLFPPPKTVTIPLAGRTPYEAMQKLMSMPNLPIQEDVQDFWLDEPAPNPATQRKQEEPALAAAKKMEEQRRLAVAAKKQREEEQQEQQAALAQQAADALLAEQELVAAQAAAKKAKKQRQKAKKQQEQQQREEEEQLQRAKAVKQAQQADLHKHQQKQQQVQQTKQSQQVQQTKQSQQQKEDQDPLHPPTQQKQAQRPQRAQQAQHAGSTAAAAADTAQQQELVQSSTQQKQQKTINKAQHAPALSATAIKPAVAAESASQAAHLPAQATATKSIAQAPPSAFQPASSGAQATPFSTPLPTPLSTPLPPPLQPPAQPAGKAKKPRAPAILLPENPTAAPRAEQGSTAPRADKALTSVTKSSSSAYEEQGYWDSQRHAQGGLQGGLLPTQIHQGTTAALEVEPGPAQAQSRTEAPSNSPSARQCMSNGNGNGAAEQQDPGVLHSTPCSTEPQPKRLAHLWHLLCCPLTQELMVDPVIAADGFTYERSAIQAWLQAHDTSPVTNQRLLHSALLHNIAVSCAINDEVL